MDKLSEALGPWPILQLFFGVAVLGVGVYALIRGLAASKYQSHSDLDEMRQEWEMHQNLKQIAHNTRMIAENQRLMLERIEAAVEQIKALAAAIWNRGV